MLKHLAPAYKPRRFPMSYYVAVGLTDDPENFDPAWTDTYDSKEFNIPFHKAFFHNGKIFDMDKFNQVKAETLAKAEQWGKERIGKLKNSYQYEKTESN